MVKLRDESGGCVFGIVGLACSEQSMNQSDVPWKTTPRIFDLFLGGSETIVLGGSDRGFSIDTAWLGFTTSEQGSDMRPAECRWQNQLNSESFRRIFKPDRLTS
jgi:hypothetical protein